MVKTLSPVVASHFQFEKAQFRYEPFPIGCTRPVFPADLYEELQRSWPASELFAFMPKLGKKYSLSEVNNPEAYHAFLGRTPVWKEIYDEVKSPDFAHKVVRMLKESFIDLGIPPEVAVNQPRPTTETRKFWSWASHLSSEKAPGLKTRFEFSMLPADGGHIKPHTDSPGKLITLVVAFAGEDWNPAYGGATTVLRPLDATRSFNHLNKQAEFDDMEVLDSYPFQPNQCVVFVKTFNSWHAVSPMTGVGSLLMRKTLTINIELAL
jgi:hypothetical protein